MMKRKYFTSAVLAATLTVSASAESAFAIDRTANCTDGTGCTLNLLIDSAANPNNFFKVGNNVFDNFTAGLTGNGTPTVLSDIRIRGYLLADGLTPALSIVGPFSAGPNKYFDLNLDFNVTRDDGGLISSVGLDNNISTFGSGSFGSITELVNDNSPGLGQGQRIGEGSQIVFGDGSIGGQTSILLRRAVNSISVNKDILLVGGESDGDVATLSFVGQDYEQTEVPTPALLPGLLGFGATILRKRKQSAEVA